MLTYFGLGQHFERYPSTSGKQFWPK